METETLDRLYLEIAQFTTAKTDRELKLENTIAGLVQSCETALKAYDDAHAQKKSTWGGKDVDEMRELCGRARAFCGFGLGHLPTS